MDTRNQSKPRLLIVRKWTVLTYRWLGVAFCLSFLEWFVSGIVMMSCSYARVEEVDRLARAPSLDPDPIHVSPEEPLSKLGETRPVSQARLNLLNCRPSLTVKVWRFSSLNGSPFCIARQTSNNTLVIPVEGDPQNAFELDRILEIVRQAAYPDTVAQAGVGRYERYYVDPQNRQPLPMIYLELNNRARTAYYIDPKTGQSGGKLRKPFPLHSLDLPWLCVRRPAWDILVIGMLWGGTALSATSVFIGWNVCRRKFIPRRSLQGVA